ncbi:MAG: hypothetical protein RIC15_08100 [Vicingaceae bacterium]
MYRDNLIGSYQYLITVHEELMNRIVNLGMSRKLSELDDAFEAGDTYQFDLEHFRDLGDPNLAFAGV